MNLGGNKGSPSCHICTMTIVHSAVLRLHACRPSVDGPSVCNVGGSGSHRPRLEILETNWGTWGNFGETRWDGEKWCAGAQKRQ